MGLALQEVCLVVKLFAIAVALVVQGSAGYNISPFPAIFFLNPPINEGNLGRITIAKGSDAFRPASQPNGLVSQSALVPAPLKSVPMPQMIKGFVSSLSPSPLTLLPPYSSVSSSLTIHGIVPSLPPTVPQTPVALPVPQAIKAIAPSPSPSTPLVLPPHSSPPPLYVHGIVPSLPPSAPQKKDLKNKNPIPAPAAPVPVALPIPQRVEGIVPSLSPSTPTVLPQHDYVPPPITVHGILPSLPPSVPQKVKPINKNHVIMPVAPRSSSVPPDFIVHGIVPSLPPSVPQRESPNTKNPVSAPVAPVLSPSNKSSEKPPAIHPIIPGSMPPSSHENIAPVPNASTPKKMPESPPPFVQPIMAGVPPYIFPVPVASPRSKLLPNSPTIQPIIPKEPPSNLPEHSVSSVSPPPITNRKSDGMPIAAPPNEIPHQISPWNPSPNKEFGVSPVSPPPITNRKSGGGPIAAPPNEKPHQFSPWNPSPNKELGVSPISPPPITKPKSDGMPIVAPPNETPHQISPRNPSPNKEFGVSPVSSPPIANRKSGGGPIAAPPNETPHQFSPWNPSPNKEPGVSPVSPPITNRKSGGVPIAAPPNETPHQISPWKPSPNKGLGVSPISSPPITKRKSDGVPIAAPPNEIPHQLSPWNASPDKAPSMHKSLKHSHSSASPLSSPKSPHMGSRSPASLPSTSFHKHHKATVNITIPAPSPLFLPPASSQQGPYIAPAPSYTFSTHPNREQPDHAPPPRNPESHVSPEPSAYPKAPSRQNILPFRSPKISPSGSSPRNPKRPNSPPIKALPPPPPNEDCSSLACVEPLTNPPPGSPCDCVLPMQVGLRLSVALYTFFPLVSELAEEIAVGVFMKQSQVRIMGANAASQDPEKTIVLANLVPLGEKFDNTTAYLTFQRFWHKQVEINNSLFGDYDVLYVYYPGLPPSPPSNTNGGPDSDHGDNGASMHPLGVDVKKRRHKAGPNRSLIAIIVLSASMAVILCCAVAWVWLFKHRDHQRESTSLATLPSLSKPSGTAASMIGSGPSSVSLSFESSFATYAGPAKTFSAIDIERATDNFNASRVLGEGGFGRVYSGALEDGTRVAVKVLKRDDRQGGREFLAEVEMLSRLHHRNLVKLIGICIERSRCLVYELIPNGSVESHLHGIDKDTAPLDWSARIKIALGAARGLAYLHEDSSPRVIHRDFKSSNILLEHDFTPKVSDFGLARTALDGENRHISTRVMGTFGYVAPEYAMTGHLLVKSDVYSFGVVLLELLTGRKPVDMSQPPGQENLVAWARPLLTSKEGLESIIDPSLGPYFPFDSIAKVAAIASMCAQPEVSHRPFMGEVVQALKLVCNESEETKELRSRSCSQDDVSIDMDAGVVSTNSGQLRDPLQAPSPVSNYDSGIDVERGLSASDLLSSAAVLGGQESWSFRRHSSSGSLGTVRGRQLWQKIRSLSRGTASEHGTTFRLRPRSH